MSFKDQLERDNETFINFSEFATKHTINGVEKTVVIDEELYNLRRSGGQWSDSLQAGTYSEGLIFHVKLSDLTRPAINTLMVFDGKRFIVNNVSGDEMILTITLGANRS